MCFSSYRCLQKKKLEKTCGKVSERRIREWRAHFASGLQGRGSHTGNVFLGNAGITCDATRPPVVMGDESLMLPKAHGTSAVPVQEERESKTLLFNKWCVGVRERIHDNCIVCSGGLFSMVGTMMVRKSGLPKCLILFQAFQMFLPGCSMASLSF